MPAETNPTHDPTLKSWIESANDPATDFPIQNLPLAVTHAHPRAERGKGAAVVVPIGDQCVSLTHCLVAAAKGELAIDRATTRAMEGMVFPGVYGLRYNAEHWGRIGRTIRGWVSRVLRADDATLRDHGSLRDLAVVPLSEVSLTLPLIPISNYTDFYASIHHATTVGAMFRPDNPLLPNYKHIPIGYHGRASSIVPSGTDIRRPRGQQSPPDNDPKAPPAFGPCKMLDYELEVGMFIGPGNTLGEPIPIVKAPDHIFGLCLVNDWSARDIQKWEYQPLGPFLAKNFATTISPFVVTMEALAPFRVPAYRRPDGDPRPLPYLFDERDQATGGLDITLEVYLQSAEMQKRGLSPILLSKSNAFKDLYWTVGQLVTHHTSNGCNLQPGDLLASGTVSGRGPTERGCLLELTWDGTGADGKPKPRKPIQLPSGETRTFLADGDEVIFKGYCERDGFRRIGFGECRGRIVPA
jgi:fumarylacetoacetase